MRMRKAKDSARGTARGERMADHEYRVTIHSDEEDTLRRIAILHSSMYRILRVARLCRVDVVDHEQGRIQLRVHAPAADPMIVPGEVWGRVEDLGPID